MLLVLICGKLRDNCIDSGRQFVAKNGVLRRADAGVTRNSSRSVSMVINRWDEQSFDRRYQSTQNVIFYCGRSLNEGYNNITVYSFFRIMLWK